MILDEAWAQPWCGLQAIEDLLPNAIDISFFYFKHPQVWTWKVMGAPQSINLKIEEGTSNTTLMNEVTERHTLIASRGGEKHVAGVWRKGGRLLLSRFMALQKDHRPLEGFGIPTREGLANSVNNDLRQRRTVLCALYKGRIIVIRFKWRISVTPRLSHISINMWLSEPSKAHGDAAFSRFLRSGILYTLNIS